MLCSRVLGTQHLQMVGAVLGQAWSECVDSQRAGGQDFTEECAERTGALQACACANLNHQHAWSSHPLRAI